MGASVWVPLIWYVGCGVALIGICVVIWNALLLRAAKQRQRRYAWTVTISDGHQPTVTIAGSLPPQGGSGLPPPDPNLIEYIGEGFKERRERKRHGI